MFVNAGGAPGEFIALKLARPDGLVLVAAVVSMPVPVAPVVIGPTGVVVGTVGVTLMGVVGVVGVVGVLGDVGSIAVVAVAVPPTLIEPNAYMLLNEARK